MNGMVIIRYVFITVLSLALTATSVFAAIPSGTAAYSVHHFGAMGDGHSKDTAAVQQTLDACSAGGGGTVYFAPMH